MGLARAATIEQQSHGCESVTRLPGRPSLLPEDVLHWVTDFVRERCAQHRPVTYGELLDRLQFNYEIVLSGDSLRHIVRSMPLIKSVVGKPEDSKRVDVDPAEIDAWYATLPLQREWTASRGGSSSTWMRPVVQSTPTAMR
jgi:transposase